VPTLAHDDQILQLGRINRTKLLPILLEGRVALMKKAIQIFLIIPKLHLNFVV
jgi:hypothetical protein